MNVKQNNLFLPAFSLWFVSELIVMDTTLSEAAGDRVISVFRLMEYTVLLFLLLQCIFLQRYSWRQLTGMAVFAVPVLISGFFSRDMRFVSMLLLAAAGKNTDFDDIVRCTCYILAGMIPLVIILCLAGILPDHTTSALYRGVEIRHSLGFSLPNRLGFRVFQLFSCHFYLRRGKLRFRDWIYGISAIVFIYLVPNFLTACFCIGLLLLFSFADCFLQRYGKGLLSLYRNVLLCIALASNIISVYVSCNGWKNGVWADVDALISYRFSYCHQVFLKYGLSLFGKNISGSSDILLDNGYMTILIRFGILMYLVISAALLAGLVYYRNRNPALFLILIVLGIDGISQEIIFRVSCNVFLLATADILCGKCRTLDCPDTEGMVTDED